MTKSIEAQSKKSLQQIHKETIVYPFEDIVAAQIFPKAHTRKFVVLEKFEEVFEAAKSREKQWSAVVSELREALTKSQKRFSHIENWHRDYVTPDNFKDCQDVGQTPESYLRRGKIECRESLTKADQMLKEMGIKL